MDIEPRTLWGFTRKSWPVIDIIGSDHLDFMQRLSTQNVMKMQMGDVAPCAFLNGNGTVIGLFLLVKKSDRVTLLPEPQSASIILQHISKLHFAEQIEVQDHKADWIEIRGTKAREFVSEKLGGESIPAEKWGGLGWLVKPEKVTAILPMLSMEEYYAERAFNLFPRDQVDVNEANIILEAGLSDYIHRDKGCYPGQEVIERIYTYGNVAKRLVLLESHAKELESGNELYSSEKKIGNVTSRHSVSKSGSHLYVATVFRMQALVGNIFSLGAGQTPQLKVLKIANDA